MRKSSQQCGAFTLTEVLVVIGILGILAALLLPALKSAKARSKTVACISQLRQIGVASLAFAEENNQRFPAATMPNTNRFLSPLQAASRELGSLKLFLCPADAERTAGTNLTSLDRTNTSYFVSYSARADQPQSIVMGDRNFTVIIVPSSTPTRISGAWRLFRTNNSFGWRRDMHQGRGNLLLADGSARETDPQKLNAQIAVQPAETFGWYIPNGDSISTP
jgi:prepilin-type N-terminal cleavage/methylation domain-containing protein/prepilin-type processing-associated H-X9-DG protein